MKIHLQPGRDQWKSLTARPAADVEALAAVVQPILADVRDRGETALREYTLRFDGVSTDELEVPESAFEAAEAQVAGPLKAAIRKAAAHIEAFHRAQADHELRVDVMPGVSCWRRSVPMERVGIYIPGGSAPLFSTVLMLAIPARLAGCDEVIMCSPPGKDGEVHPAVLFAARLAGVHRVFRVGGAQAIAALAFGAGSIPAVDKIFGPGNAYVTAAKQEVARLGIAIDMPAGPSEVLVYADSSAHPAFIAADLLSQAEHGPDSQTVLVSTSPEVAEAVNEALQTQLASLPRAAIATKALDHSFAVVIPDPDEAMAFVNAYAPEHLILMADNARDLSRKVRHAGSVFMGHYSPESVGDYASGTNHTLPTAGFARAWSGVSLDSFVKKITFQELTPEGLLKLGPVVEVLAQAETLDAHARAVSIRTDYLKQQDALLS